MQGLSHQRRRSSSGFSLLELSVVLAIISIVAVMGLEGVGSFMSHTAYEVTQDKLAVVKTALAKHRQVYGYLPCPAVPSLDINNTGYGKEARSSGVCSASSYSADIYYGDLPVRDLGLPLSYMKDGYGNKMRYAVSRTMTTVALFSNVASLGAIPIRTGKIQEPCTVCQIITGQAAYVVLSFGGDKRDNRTTSCIGGNALYDGMIDSVNCRTAMGGTDTVVTGGNGAAAAIPLGTFYDSRFNNGTVEASHFDDLILWQTKGQL
jgi:prepilin-type N-terminal cleavage/methylation domain-containing protein